MAVRRTTYLCGVVPTPAHLLPSMKQMAIEIGAVGWKNEPKAKHAEAVATFKAESLFDQWAYLSYLSIPGSPGDPKKKPWPLKWQGLVMPQPNYLLNNGRWTEEDASDWQRKVYWNNVTWLKTAFPRKGEGAPKFPQLDSVLRKQPKYDELEHRRITIEKSNHESGQPRIDFNVPQLNSDYYLITWNRKKALQKGWEIYVGRSRTFSAWMANTGGSYEIFMDDATAVVESIR